MTILSINSDNPEQVQHALEDILKNYKYKKLQHSGTIGATAYEFERNIEHELGNKEGYAISALLHFSEQKVYSGRLRGNTSEQQLDIGEYNENLV